MNEDKTENSQTPQSDNTSDALVFQVEKILNKGDGLGKVDGQAVFVPLTAPGDRIRARVVKRGRGFLQAACEEVLEPGPDRREAPCAHYGECGGCNLQHITDDAQRHIKADIVLDCFQRVGKLDMSGLITGPDPTGNSLGYRNRIRLYGSPMGPYGMMKRGTHDVVPLNRCELLPEAFNRDILPWLIQLPPVEQVLVRLDSDGHWLLSIFGAPTRMRVMKKIIAALGEDEAPAPGCVGMLFNNRPIWGRDYLVHEVAGHKFRVGAQSFFQGNPAVAAEAVDTVRAWVQDLSDREALGGLLGDLFCGVGLFSLTLADLFDKIVAIDNDPYACRDAENNVQRDPGARGKVKLHIGAMAEALKNVDLAPPALWRESCCLIDPPRTGIGAEGVASLTELAPRQIIFMSCDPATLARDAAGLIAAGYEARKLKVLDMFPQTSHIETLMLLEKKD